MEVLTIDKSQGIDRDMIVFVYPSRKIEESNELLRNWRRINVAFTRARKKLLIIGSKSAMKQVDLMQQLIEIMEKKNWIYNFDKSILDQLKF